jgi:hypothetical protein
MEVEVIAILAVLLAQTPTEGNPAPRKLKITVEHFKIDLKQAVPLKPEEAKSFAAELKELPGILDATCTESLATITIKPDAALKLSELRMTGKKTLTYEGGKPVMVVNTIKLEGHVSLNLHVEKNPEKVKDALKEIGFKDPVENGNDIEGTFKSPVDVVTVIKKVCQKTGADYKIFDILKDITWLPAAAKATATDK